MSPTETARLVGEIIGIFVVLIGGLAWLTRLLWRVREAVVTGADSTLELGKEFKALNGSLNVHLAEDLAIQKKLGGDVEYLRGQMQERGAVTAEAAQSAANLINNAAIAAAKLISDATEAKVVADDRQIAKEHPP